jgi:hypothetical protein
VGDRVKGGETVLALLPVQQPVAQAVHTSSKGQDKSEREAQ